MFAKELKIILDSQSLTSSITTHMLPLQGDDLWRTWAAKDKEEYRQKEISADLSTYEYVAQVNTEKDQKRRDQLCYIEQLTPLMKSFLVSLLKLEGDSNKYSRNIFIQSLKLELNHISRNTVLELVHEHELIRKLLKEPQGGEDNIEKLTKRLNILQEDIIKSSIGLEHLLREVGQMYEAVAAVRPHDYGNELSRLPKAVAELLIDGWPLGSDGWRCCSCASEVGHCCTQKGSKYAWRSQSICAISPWSPEHREVHHVEHSVWSPVQCWCWQMHSWSIHATSST